MAHKPPPQGDPHHWAGAAGSITELDALPVEPLPPELLDLTRATDTAPSGSTAAAAPAGRSSRNAPPLAGTGTGPAPVHHSLIAVAAPSLAISAEDGRLPGTGLDGFYDAGRRVLARCELHLAGQEPTPLQGRMTGAGESRFVAALAGPRETGPDPVLTVERLRSAEGTERITVRNSSLRLVRLPLELRLGTDLAELGEIAAGRAGPPLPATVHGSGLAWTSDGLRATVTAEPAPDVSLAAGGLLRWVWELEPGAGRTVQLRISLSRSGPGARKTGRTRPPQPWFAAAAEADDPRIGALFRTSLDDLAGLLLRDETRPSRTYLAAGVPWRCAFSPAESLRAARMLLPLGTRLAAGTLHTLARGQATHGPDVGRLPGPLRHAGPHSGPSCTGLEATLLFPVVLAEAYRWGLPLRDVEQLLPAAEACLRWLLRAGYECGYVPDPVPEGPYRCETQAQAHRAALLGADLLDSLNRSGADELRSWAAESRRMFRQEFWWDEGGRPVGLWDEDGRPSTHLGSVVAELLDGGLVGAGLQAECLLDHVQTAQLARLLAGPTMDSGWGLRTLASAEPGYNPFGYRSGVVRVQDTATAVAGLLDAGFEREARSLLHGVIDAAETFGNRLPEMYAAEQRTEGSAPLPHPTACRPSALAAAGVVRMLTAVAGIRPDVPAQTVRVRPAASAPLGAVQFTGLSVAEAPFAVRINRLGAGMVEQAADGLRLGG
ncbi:glycogen debranching N-terminal domain-containing protein [Streptomyces sp. HNM0574]|uniref:glycogen debranching N-terminal domain-containing protein n=1 Tax=Streptomyces sp. HNM0574 TaxID=2714954 RepID=UPI003216D518